MKKSVKYILTLGYGVGLATTTAMAAKTGFYGGPMAGFSNIHSTNNVISGTNGQRIGHSKTKKNAFLAGALVGWGVRSGCLYGAMEFDGFYADMSKTLIHDTEFTNERMHLKNKYQLGGGLRFGFVQSINTCMTIMPFVRMGFQVGKYTRKYTVKDQGLVGGSYTKKKNTNVFSVVPVIGAELTIKDHYSLRIEGRYAPRFTHRLFTGTVPDIVAKFSDSTLYTAASQRAILVSAIYHL